ncbi:hypothetical protein B0T10DRAFT_453488 [Thelonectria olida]|uniref:Uncharacterized protein n=1 Tax=Thelonectria olida TaxID=1576542 RepID=A0A9P8WHL5_9HYPO|nr:hypothetical protein B0T10DRAFT_453488 [Thelonectria olida]
MAIRKKRRYQQVRERAKRRRHTKEVKRDRGGDAKDGIIEANLDPDGPKALEGPAADPSDADDDDEQDQDPHSVPRVVPDMSNVLPAAKGVEPEPCDDGAQEQDAASIPRIIPGEPNLTKTNETILGNGLDDQILTQDDDVKMADGDGGNGAILWPFTYTAPGEFEKPGQPSPQAKSNSLKGPIGSGQLVADQFKRQPTPPQQDDSSEEEPSSASSSKSSQKNYSIEKDDTLSELLGSSTLNSDQP